MSSSRSSGGSHGNHGRRERGAQVRIAPPPRRRIRAAVCIQPHHYWRWEAPKSTPNTQLTRGVPQRSVRRIIESLQSRRINTLTELVRIERIAATCEDENDAAALQGPMTEAWTAYVASHQFLTELRGLTRNYPFCGDILADAQARVRNDPDSNRSWNMAWLCLRKIVDEYVFAFVSHPRMNRRARGADWREQTATSPLRTPYSNR